MTREEYLEALRGTPLSSKNLDVVPIMSKYIYSLEQRIAKLELQLADANTYFDGIHTELLANKIKES